MSPMTVRWKPLMVLSGLFLVFAVAGLLAIAFALVPRNSAELLRLAQDERAAKQYERAVIQYRRALQQSPRDARIHQEMADLYAEWAGQAPPEKRAELRAQRLRALVEAAKFDKKGVAPRRLLLAEALRCDDASDASHWARELVALEPTDADANFVLAEDA